MLFGILTGLLGILVLVGWQFDVGFLLRPIPGSVAMNPLTALCFTLLGMAVVLNHGVASQIAAWVVLAVCTIKMVLWMSSSGFAVDQMLFASKLSMDNYRGLSNRMAPNTAIAFLVSSGALLIWPRSVKGRLPELLAMVTLLLGMLSMIGYGYRVPEFYGVLKAFPMAVHTAFGFVLLSVGLLSSSRPGPFVTAITSKGTGGVMARWLLPLAILLPIGLGALRLYGERQGLYSGVFGLMLHVVVMMAIFCFIIWRLAAYANKHELQLKDYAEKLESLNNELERQVQARTTALEHQTKVLEVKLKEVTDYRYALDQGTIVAITDQQGTILHVNENFCSISGYQEDELLGQDHRIVNSGYHSQEFMHDLWKTIANGKVWRGIIRNRKKNGEYYWVDTTIVPFLNDQGKPVRYMAIRSDLTDLKETAQQLANSEARFRYTLDNMLEGAQVINEDYRYAYLNKAVLKHGKNTMDEMLSRTMMECYPGIEHTDLFTQVQKCMAAPQGTNRHIENRFEYPDGTNAWFELSIQRVPEGVFILSIDITDRKNAEARLMELNRSLEKKVNQRTAQLRASNKELESFSYSVSHDLRAPLRAVNGFSEMLEQQYAANLDDNGKRLLGIIKSNALTMGRLIDDLLEFSRTGRKEVQTTSVDMAAIVQSCLKDLHEAYAPTSYTVQLRTLPQAACDPQMIVRVWTNLLSNAFKYSAKQEQPMVQVWGEELEEDIVYHVQDNGAGFNMKYADKLFGVFQRLHSNSEFEGTGVGLAIVNRILNKHGGRVWAEAEEGKGATFHFSLPKQQLNKELKTTENEHEQESSRVAAGRGQSV